MSTTDFKSLGLSYIYSTEKAKRLLGWSVNEDLEFGLLKWKSWHEMYLKRKA